MKKAIAIICSILIIAINTIAIASALAATTTGTSKPSSMKWSDDTEAFVEKTFGHYESDYEKAAAFKDWIVKNIEYTPYQLPLIQAMDADSVIAAKEGICYEQASLFTVFCRISNIECYNVDGRAKRNSSVTHSWNRFCIDGQWYEIDITHDQSASAAKAPFYGIREIEGLKAPDKTYRIYRIY